ncbi:STAS domain-containing protein [Lichenifustis flavocetrariae]|uniref:STAS domain-containing protein n=1 Tax=Lichenifustis flavocetrariae TaxID=2949735 RepID=A0AA42CHU3_9HYPH|nr:STAS domain-containing protein [Lichenifustis flavocetrariae]MCW6507639.1 STAS domain-containing protein [Lichenifustis flavocetrariae]
MQTPQTISLPGDCVLSDIAAVRQSLLDAFAFGGPIELDMSKLARIDVSFVQLVVAASRTASQTETQLTFSNVPDAVKATLQNAGLDLATLMVTGPH